MTRLEATRAAREIVEAVPHGIALLDLDGIVLDVNPAAELLLGYDRGDIVGKSCQPFTHPDDHDSEVPLLDAVMHGASDGYTIEKRYLHKNGEHVWASIEVRLIRDEQGAPVRLLALIEDISERRRRDEEQKRLTEQVRTILESITDGFVALDPDWRYTYVNERAGELLGRKPEDLIGKNIWEEFPDGVGRPYYDAYHRAMGERTTIFFEDHYEPGDRWFENRVYGSHTGLAIYFTEVTERKRVEMAERRQRERAEALRAANETLTRTLDLEEALGVLLDSMTAFVPYTSAGVLLLTEDAQLAVGAVRGYYKQFDFPELASWLPRLREHPRIREVIEEGRTVVVGDVERDELHRAPPHIRSWIGVPLRAGSQMIGLCSVESSQPGAFRQEDADWAQALTAQASGAIQNARLHDQLRRHAAELERRVAERTRDLRDVVAAAEHANRAKSEFLAGISHELRTPMNAILGFAQLLELDELGGEQADNVQHILRAGRHLLELITELLDIARIEAGELALSLEAVSVEHLVVEAVDLTRPLAEKTGVSVSVDGGADGYVLADRQRALQVLLNLLANAVKFNRRGGTVDITTSRDVDARLAIVVRDTGQGIAPDDLERLFLPFERLGLEGGAIEGAGLGLALARRLVEAMDGTIRVASSVGVGSTFTVELPHAEDPLAALDAVPAERSVREARDATILYIEDNLANLQLVERALARQPGWTVLTATQGRLGLELARDRRPDLVLLDLHLPDISGEEVLAELTASSETAAIPVVVVSAAASKGRVQRLRQRGAHDYLTKPIDLAELLEVIDAALGAQRV